MSDLTGAAEERTPTSGREIVFQCHLTPPPSSKLVCAASRSVIACDRRSFVRLYELDGSRRSDRATVDQPMRATHMDELANSSRRRY